jgi:hypothetical protein
VHWAPGIPRALLSSRDIIHAKLGRVALRERGVIFLDRHAPLYAGPGRRDVLYAHDRLWNTGSPG